MTSGKPLPGAVSGERPHIAVRLDPSTLARVDALAVAMSSPFVVITRSDVVRALIGEALPALEARHVQPKGGRR